MFTKTAQRPYGSGISAAELSCCHEQAELSRDLLITRPCEKELQKII